MRKVVLAKTISKQACSVRKFFFLIWGHLTQLSHFSVPHEGYMLNPLSAVVPRGRYLACRVGITPKPLIQANGDIWVPLCLGDMTE